MTNKKQTDIQVDKLSENFAKLNKYDEHTELQNMVKHSHETWQQNNAVIIGFLEIFPTQQIHQLGKVSTSSVIIRVVVVITVIINIYWFIYLFAQAHTLVQSDKG